MKSHGGDSAVPMGIGKKEVKKSVDIFFHQKKKFYLT